MESLSPLRFLRDPLCFESESLRRVFEPLPDRLLLDPEDESERESEPESDELVRFVLSLSSAMETTSSDVRVCRIQLSRHDVDAEWPVSNRFLRPVSGA
ncbi:hypothetical protein [Saccharopolyspora rosea]|uniref:Uncharacterized protein n=1 Tax=Saccharopolyspora rosea TaxID=524884 RepID=A0ABW3FMW4_9PSEU|nr:hypothetical protein [Saccharopolyspora rosea]